MVICTKLHEKYPEYFDELGNYRPWEKPIEDGYKVPLDTKISAAKMIDQWEMKQKAKGTKDKFI